MGYSKFKPGPYHEMLRIAMTKGACARPSTNRAVYVQEDTRRIPSFAGAVLHVDGSRVLCKHYDSWVFAINIEAMRVTNFGMDHFSQSTGQHIRGWRDAVQKKFKGRALPSWVLYEYGRWTTKKIHLDRFAARVPWCFRDASWSSRGRNWREDGTNWFLWDRFDRRLANRYSAGNRFLRLDQNWRYYEYDWDKRGRWVRKFKDDDARRRWTQRQQLRARKAAQPCAIARATKPSSRPSSIVAVLQPLSTSVSPSSTG